MRRIVLLVLVPCGLAGLLVALPALSSSPGQSAPLALLYVAPDANCGGALPCYGTIQEAVDAAAVGGEIRVAAGVYTDVHSRPAFAGYSGSSVVTQVVYISKTVTIRGGYTATNWVTPYPIIQPTILDARRQGRVLCVDGTTNSVFEGLRITGGDSRGEAIGAGVYAAGGTITVSNCQVLSNTAAIGGGVYVEHGDIRLAGNTIAFNGAIGGGGVELYYATGELTDNIISHNVAAGGGLRASTLGGSSGGGVGLYKSSAMLAGNTIAGNASSGGGGVWVYVSSVTLERNVVVSNTANWDGGGLWAIRSPVILNSNVISANTAGHYGGGINISQSGVDSVNDVTIDNEAGMGGGGLYLDGSTLRLYHATIARNSDDGVYVGQEATTPDPSSLFAANAVLISHTVGVTVTAGSAAALDGVLWYSNTANTGGNGIVTVTNAIIGDPIFAPDGYHLAAGSAAIDKALDAGVTTDIDGRYRPQGVASDLGADEFPGVALTITKSGPATAGPGQRITYTLIVTNYGDLAVTGSLTVIDRVPTGTDLVDWPVVPIPPVDTIAWVILIPSTGTLDLPQVWQVRFSVVVTAAAGTIVNQEYRADGGGVIVHGARAVVTHVFGQHVYLPVVMCNYAVSSLLVNGDFEIPPPWPMQNDLGEIQVAPGWRAWYLDVPPAYIVPSTNCEGKPAGCYWMRPEFRAAEAVLLPHRVRSGSYAHKYFSFGRMHEGGLMQQVGGVTSGDQLAFSVYMKAWMCSDAAIANCQQGLFSDAPGDMHLRVGLDPYGGADPLSSHIVWSAEKSAWDSWTYFEVQTTAESPTVTVFTHSRAEWPDLVPRMNNDVYVDDAWLTKWP